MASIKMKENFEQFLHNPFLNCALSVLNTLRKMANINSVLKLSWQKEKNRFTNANDVSNEEKEGHTWLVQAQGNSAAQQASA